MIKRIIFSIIFLIITFISIDAQQEAKSTKQAKISFEKTTHNFGTFSADSAMLTCEFKFKNTGDGDLYIHQAFASCGCTVPQFPTEAIKPGEEGIIKVTYDGTRKSPGSMRRSITIHNNSKTETVRLYLTGKMTPKKITKTDIIEVE